MHNEPWQVFAQNGEPIVGYAVQPSDFESDSALVRAASHVWIWRRTSGGCEVLLQKRAPHVRHGGKYDISAAGHLDESESAVAAAVREAKEEIGLDIDPIRLRLVAVCRKHRRSQSFNYVYLYELQEEPTFATTDGEVDELLWVSLDTFSQYVENPEESNLNDQGKAYFVPLLDALEWATA